MQFGNDTLPPLHSWVLATSRLHNMVESHTSQQSQPITFDWTGIKYPPEWEDKYDHFQAQFDQNQIVQPMK
jgi:hypothetical protein